MSLRPSVAQKQPDVNQSQAILKKLLEVELNRLETAVRIEKERKIVFPETSIIIHDIQKLNSAINGKSNKSDLFDVGDFNG